MISLSRVRLFATPWTVAYQAPQSMGFSRQEYWSGLPFPSPADLPNPGIEPGSPALQTDALPSEALGKPDSRLGSFKNLRPLSVANVPDFLLGKNRKNKQTKENQCARGGTRQGGGRHIPEARSPAPPARGWAASFRAWRALCWAGRSRHARRRESG